MTSLRTPSVRAAARRRHAEVAETQGLAPDPQAPIETPLIERVRALYEDGVLPVREIARLVGVTERTIYKYAQKGGWRPRVVRLSRGADARCIPLSEEAAAAAVAAARERFARAEALKRTKARLRALDHLRDALTQLAAIRAEVKGGHASGNVVRVADRLGRVLAAQMAQLLGEE